MAFFSRFAGAPGGRLEVTASGIRVTSGVPFALANWVLRTDSSESEIDRLIASTLEHYRERELPFVWSVGPDDRPARLRDKLRALGVAEDWSTAMALDLGDLPSSSSSEDLTVEPVASPEALRVFARTLNRGDFQARPSVERAIPDLLRPSLFPVGEEPELRAFLGYAGGVPVATSARFLCDGVVGVYGVATIPEARRKGFGTSMTLAALREGQSLGYGVGVLQATHLGEPVYRRMGFREMYRVGEFEFSRSPPDH